MALLSLALVQHFLVACEDLREEPAGRLHYRFLGWVHDHRSNFTGRARPAG